MRLGIDLDGVVADFDGGWTRMYAEEFGRPPHQAVREWDGLHRLTHFADMAEFWDWMHSREIFGQLDLVPGALAGLTELAADHDIVIITAKQDAAIPQTLRWIADRGLPTREIHFTSAKHEVACDVYLDDSPRVLPRLVQHRPQALVCRMVAPWNEPVPGTVDIAGWPEFVAAVAAHAVRSLTPAS